MEEFSGSLAILIQHGICWGSLILRSRFFVPELAEQNSRSLIYSRWKFSKSPHNHDAYSTICLSILFLCSRIRVASRESFRNCLKSPCCVRHHGMHWHDASTRKKRWYIIHAYIECTAWCSALQLNSVISRREFEFKEQMRLVSVRHKAFGWNLNNWQW